MRRSRASLTRSQARHITTNSARLRARVFSLPPAAHRATAAPRPACRLRAEGPAPPLPLCGVAPQDPCPFADEPRGRAGAEKSTASCVITVMIASGDPVCVRVFSLRPSGPSSNRCTSSRV